MRGLCLTHPVLVSFLCGEFFLHFPCYPNFSLKSFYFTSCVGFFLFFNLGSFSYTSCASFVFIGGVPLTHPVLASFLFVYTSRTGFIFIRGVCFTHPRLVSFFLSGEFLLHISCCYHFYAWSLSYTTRGGFISLKKKKALGSFSYTSRAGFIFIREVPLTSRAGFIFMWAVSLIHPVLASFFFYFFLSGEFLLSRAGLRFMGWGGGGGGGVSLKHPVLAPSLCWALSYTSRAGLIFMRGVSLTIPVLS